MVNRADGRSLYFRNEGLFADNYLLNRLPNESLDSFVLRNWDTEALPEFNECYEWMLSTWHQEQELLKSQSEAQLEEHWIKPILQKLGWTFQVQDRHTLAGQTRIPDYTLFSSAADFRAAQRSRTQDAYCQKIKAVADAKAMQVSLDGEGRNRSNPNYQIVSYMDSMGTSWGILTNGEVWRLYSSRPRAKTSTFYEVNVKRFLNPNGGTRNDEAFKYFFNFFRKDAFVPVSTEGKSFVDIVFESGERYAEDVETELKKRAFKIVESISRGFVENKKNLDNEDLSAVYENSLYLLFRLLFILNCESKNILDVNDYTKYGPYSLRTLILKLKSQFESDADWSGLSTSYDFVKSLMRIIRDGDKRIGIKGFGQELFSVGDETFFEEHTIPDYIFNQILIDLAFSFSEDKKIHFIDYSRLGPDHLGSIFEGLLEYELSLANEDLGVSPKGDILPVSDLKDPEEIIKKGQVYLSSSSGKRKDTGSYYTPSYVVDYMVRNTLIPLCADKSSKEILDLRICDPAMGSGHFLLGAIVFLEEQIKTRIVQEQEADFKVIDLSPSNIRWEILKNCIRGVDKNPLAVELAKFSLWVYTARRNELLEPLDDQLKPGDSLTPNSGDGIVWQTSFKEVHSAGGFDAIVGNPPYVARRNSDYVEIAGASTGQGDLYLIFLKHALNGSIPLKDNGLLSFIVPDPILIRGNAKEIRSQILANHTLATCVHINGVFDAGVSNVILTIRKSGAQKNQANFFRIDNKKHRDRFKETSVIPKEAFKVKVNLDLFKTDDFAWTYLLEESDLSSLNLLKRSNRCLQHYFEDRRGEEVGKKKIREHVTRSGRAMLIGGEAIAPFLIKDEGILYVSPKVIRKSQEFYQAPKVILQKSAPRFVCSVDNGEIDPEGVAVPQSIYILQPKAKDQIIDSWTIAAILNSKLANDYLYKCITGYKLLQPHYEQRDLKTFPIFNVDKLDGEEVLQARSSLLKELHDKTLNLHEPLLKRERALAAISAASEYCHLLAKSNAPSDELQKYRDFLEANIKAMYRLSEAAAAVA
ncbi:MAG: hypothetical protein COV44_08940 [Deltaproteobacteria bacterium CG11_big_fil_rev_8_21_14_0_20_45_16]|nr:MAG: hypothetical protein COV44_08940 [Deltaproteobacteria bacterium CG11_big_fil_rev_8_21_14_0_20_45_16]